ncbi:MAG: D-aminoacylase [candidate division KSB1 bacterium]|nr:D-aminoacylase [candidate division KSB1 bacterium]MDZ7386253.1 D-aminoacylase [candidate division KSB1 bacterium]MDZ7393265.1 D-aminoacylase [candidate division KSB1 bacterium]MDZ7412351.1 D-aminoacylase [candidate division KSB1 bacterium]
MGNRQRLLALTAIVFALAMTTLSCTLLSRRYSLIVTGGTIVDGTGGPPLRADIGVIGGRVAVVGEIERPYAERVIDATGLYVAPGFIDVHTHTDRQIAEHPDVLNYLLQGVTTVVGGNCGDSEYPLAELFRTLERRGIAINFASFVGHNTIRHLVLGDSDKVVTPEALAMMKALVEQEMRAGAIGLSTGLAYVPGRYSTTEELIELARAVKPYGGIYATHLRDQGQGIRQAIEEALRIGREAGVPVQISHIKLADEAVWGEYQLITQPVEAARAEGMSVYLDQYPYTATSSGFSSSFPGWAVDGGHEAFVQRLQDPATYQRIKQALIQKRLTSPRGIDKVATILIARAKNHPEYEGKNLAEILKLRGQAPTVENAAALIIELERDDQPSAIFFQMAEEDVTALMKLPYTMIASDGGIAVPGEGSPHPRAYGTFPRVLGTYVRERGVLSLPEAIAKMTSLPAQAMGFTGRGAIKKGYWADLVIFSPEEVRDCATFAEPHQYPQGIRYVVVNGKIAARDGQVFIRDAGHVLYGKGRLAR